MYCEGFELFKRDQLTFTRAQGEVKDKHKNI